jgi:hypothetical protein
LVAGGEAEELGGEAVGGAHAVVAAAALDDDGLAGDEQLVALGRLGLEVRSYGAQARLVAVGVGGIGVQELAAQGGAGGDLVQERKGVERSRLPLAEGLELGAAADYADEAGLGVVVVQDAAEGAERLLEGRRGERTSAICARSQACSRPCATSACSWRGSAACSARRSANAAGVGSRVMR